MPRPTRLATAVALVLLSAPAAARPPAPPPGDTTVPVPPPGGTAGAPVPPPGDAATTVRRWSAIACEAVGLDHAPPEPGETRVLHGEQAGPARTARALGMVHIAIFEAVNAVEPRYGSYLRIRAPPGPASERVAIAEAAHDVLASLFTAQGERLAAWLAQDLEAEPDGPARDAGVELGRHVAATLLALRAGDGSEHEEPIVGEGYPLHRWPGKWRPDPVSGNLVALGARWGNVRPFAMYAAHQFRAPPPPPLTSAAYAAAFLEVKRFGGDGVLTPTERSDDQTLAAKFWGYDGTPHLGAPPRLYNLIALRIAEQMGTVDAAPLARLLALVNVSMADTAIATWESKYRFAFWRPVTGVREGDPGAGPLGKGDWNPLTDGDPGFTPLGAPATYLAGPAFTPPFPAYPSGHASFGAALFQTLRNVYGTDAIPFTFVSEELDGEAHDAGGTRPRAPRHFESLSQAEEENGQSRIWLGVHWEFDKTAGIAQGRKVADLVFRRHFRPRGERHKPR